MRAYARLSSDSLASDRCFARCARLVLIQCTVVLKRRVDRRPPAATLWDVSFEVGGRKASGCIADNTVAIHSLIVPFLRASYRHLPTNKKGALRRPLDSREGYLKSLTQISASVNKTRHLKRLCSLYYETGLPVPVRNFAFERDARPRRHNGLALF